MAIAKRVMLQGASADDVLHFRNLLTQANASLLHTWKLHNGDTADLLIVDIDSVYGHMDWLRAHGAGRRTAVLTANGAFADADLVLAKPLDLIGLIRVLNRASPEILGHAPEPAPFEPPLPSAGPARSAQPAVVADAAADIAPAAPAAPAAPPRERSLADWLSVAALTRPVRLEGDGAPALVLDPGNQVFHVSGNLRTLAVYCARPIATDEWQPLAPAELAGFQAAAPAQPYARLLWLFHALGSNGYLTAALDPNAKYKLTRWPQIEREFPKHFRIATVMMKQPATLSEIADGSGGALAEVIDFVNAYHAIGYIETEAPAKSAAATGRDSGRGAILSRLRNPFGGP